MSKPSPPPRFVSERRDDRLDNHRDNCAFQTPQANAIQTDSFSLGGGPGRHAAGSRSTTSSSAREFRFHSGAQGTASGTGSNGVLACLERRQEIAMGTCRVEAVDQGLPALG